VEKAEGGSDGRVYSSDLPPEDEVYEPPKGYEDMPYYVVGYYHRVTAHANATQHVNCTRACPPVDILLIELQDQYSRWSL
jgi:hypothetical protein